MEEGFGSERVVARDAYAVSEVGGCWVGGRSVVVGGRGLGVAWIGFWMAEVGVWMAEVGYWMPEIGGWMPEVGFGCLRLFGWLDMSNLMALCLFIVYVFGVPIGSSFRCLFEGEW